MSLLLSTVRTHTRLLGEEAKSKNQEARPPVYTLTHLRRMQLDLTPLPKLPFTEREFEDAITRLQILGFFYVVEWDDGVTSFYRITFNKEKYENMLHENAQRRRDELATMPYSAYLRTQEWQERRKIALEKAGQRCQICNSKKRLHVHHRTYERRGGELPDDLTVLCNQCHAIFHENGRLAPVGGVA